MDRSTHFVWEWNMEDEMRLFYAALVDEQTRKNIEKKQKMLRPLLRKGRYIPPEQFHITLHFLGEIPYSRVKEYALLLDRAAEGITPVEVTFPGFDTFPRRDEHLIFLKTEETPAHVATAGGGPKNRLRLTAGRLKDLTQEGDLRPLKPHITLVRQGVFIPRGLKTMKHLPREEGFGADNTFLISSFGLMESRQTAQGLFYIPLHTVKLL